MPTVLPLQASGPPPIVISRILRPVRLCMVAAQRWSSAAANCAERGRDRLLAPPALNILTDFPFPVSDDSKLVASGMTERNAGAVRCNRPLQRFVRRLRSEDN